MDDLEPPPPPPPDLFDDESSQHEDPSIPQEEDTHADEPDVAADAPTTTLNNNNDNVTDDDDEEDTTHAAVIPHVESAFDVVQPVSPITPDEPVEEEAKDEEEDHTPVENHQIPDAPSFDDADAAITTPPTADDVAEVQGDDNDDGVVQEAPSTTAPTIATPQNDGDDNDTLREAQRQAGVYADPLSPTSDDGVTPTMSEDCPMYMCGKGFDSHLAGDIDGRSPREVSDIMVGTPAGGDYDESGRTSPLYSGEDQPPNNDINTTIAPQGEEGGDSPTEGGDRQPTEAGSFVDVGILDQAKRNMEAADANPEGDDFVILPEGDRPVRKNEFESFATKMIDNIDRIQDERHDFATNISEALQSVEAGLIEKMDKDVSEATTQVSETLKTDYMNHISALRQYFDSKIDEVVERGDEHVAENVKSVLSFVDDKIAASEHKTQESLAQEVQELRTANSALEEQIHVIQRNMDVVSAALHKACQLEQFPEPRAIPEGPKVRIMVRLAVCSEQNPPPMMLVPISQNATISDLKHECIRRARQQKAVQDTVVYSKTAIAFEGIALFDDDTFDDIGLKGGESVSLVFTGAEATVLRLQQQQHEAANSAASSQAASSPRPPPPMMALGSNNSSPLHSTSSLPRSGGGALPPPPGEFRVPDRPARPNTSGGSDVLAGFFLDEELSKDIAEREQLDRRLIAEVERMERDPLKQQETLCRVRGAKEAMSRIRAALLDKATYSHSEVHRAAARSTLTKLDHASQNPSATVDDIVSATRQAEHVVNNLATNAGEENRIDIIAEAAAKNQARKDRLKEELEEAAYELRHKVRVPYEMMASCEKLLDDVDRASILAQTMSADELDDMLGNIMSFMSSMKNRSRA